MVRSFASFEDRPHRLRTFSGSEELPSSCYLNGRTRGFYAQTNNYNHLAQLNKQYHMKVLLNSFQWSPTRVPSTVTTILHSITYYTTYNSASSTISALKPHNKQNRVKVLRKVKSVVPFQHSKDLLAINPGSATVDTCTLCEPTFFISLCFPGKFDRYRIKWSKFDQTRKKWILIFDYEVTDPQRQTSVLFTMKPDKDNNYFEYPGTRARGRYRAYDKAYFGSYFSGSHVLDIERVTAADLGTYKVEVFNLVRSVGNEAIIELRHEGEKKEEFTCNNFSYTQCKCVISI